MKVHNVGSAMMIVDVPDAGCFAFRRKDVTYVGIKLTNGKTVAILWPCHPNNSSVLAGLLNAPELSQFPLWLLDAVAVPNATAQEMRATEFNPQPGSLAVGPDSLFATVYYKDAELAWVNLRTGDLIHLPPRPVVWFAEWQILVPNVDGKHEVLCSIPVSPERAAMAGVLAGLSDNDRKL